MNWEEAQAWCCPDCEAPVHTVKHEAETAFEGVRHVDKVMAAHGLQPEQSREFVLFYHLTLVCANGHEHYIGEQPIRSSGEGS